MQLFYSKLLVPKADGTISSHPAGRFMIDNGNLTHLEDYHGHGIASIPEGPVTPESLSNVHPNLSIASHDDIANGHCLDFIPNHPLNQPSPQPTNLNSEQIQIHSDSKPPSTFHYHRAGHDHPHLLEVNNSQYLLDGNPLDQDEVTSIMNNVVNQTATLRYKRNAPIEFVSKAEEFFARLVKADMDPQEALAHFSGLHSSDPKSNDAIKALRRHIFEDPMTGLGNRYAYQERLKNPRPGIHLGFDLNGLKQLNDTYGHETGDQAIKAFGGAIKSATQDMLSHEPDLKYGHNRVGGDEFSSHFPTQEHAATFLRHLHNHLSQVPPIMGTHRLSTSVGIGHDSESADRALYEAKKQKVGHTPLSMPHVLSHSMVGVGQAKVA